MILNRQQHKLKYIDYQNYRNVGYKVCDFGQPGFGYWGKYESHKIIPPEKVDSLFLGSDDDLRSFLKKETISVDDIQTIYFYPLCTYPKQRLVDNWKVTSRKEKANIRVYSKIVHELYQHNPEIEILYSKSEDAYYVLDWELRAFDEPAEKLIELQLVPDDIVSFYIGPCLAFRGKYSENLINVVNDDAAICVSDFCKLIDEKFPIMDSKQMENIQALLKTTDLKTRELAMTIIISFNLFSMVARMSDALYYSTDVFRKHQIMKFLNEVYFFSSSKRYNLAQAYAVSTSEEDKEFAFKKCKGVLEMNVDGFARRMKDLIPVFKELKIIVDNEVYCDTRI